MDSYDHFYRQVQRMNFTDLYKDNISDYSEWIDPDVAENINRAYYHGIAAHDSYDDSVKAIVIWELKSLEEQADTESEIEWIYSADPGSVDPLFREYEDRIRSDEVERSFFESTVIDQPTADALEGCDFTVSSVESKSLRIPLKDFAAQPFAKKKVPDYVENIASLNRMEFCQGIVNILCRTGAESVEDLSYLPIDWFDPEVSCCIKSDGKVNGFLLIHTCSSGALMPVLFFAVGADYRQNLLEMMRYSIRSASRSYPEDTPVLIRRRNQEITLLMSKLFPSKKGAPAFAGSRKEKG